MQKEEQGTVELHKKCIQFRRTLILFVEFGLVTMRDWDLAKLGATQSIGSHRVPEDDEDSVHVPF